mgnify:CR=1 FL=1
MCDTTTVEPLNIHTVMNYDNPSINGHLWMFSKPNYPEKATFCSTNKLNKYMDTRMNDLVERTQSIECCTLI